MALVCAFPYDKAISKMGLNWYKNSNVATSSKIVEDELTFLQGSLIYHYSLSVHELCKVTTKLGHYADEATTSVHFRTGHVNF